METHKIVNLLNENDLQNLQQGEGMSLIIKITQNMVKDMKMIQALNIKQKLSN